ncbi:hypothetical protein D3C85_1801480 [compost metagenome]
MNALQEDKYIDSICWLIAFSSTLLSLGLLTVLISLFMNNTLRIKGALEQQGLTSITNGLKHPWTANGYVYEVRIHPGNS